MAGNRRQLETINLYLQSEEIKEDQRAPGKTILTAVKAWRNLKKTVNIKFIRFQRVSQVPDDTEVRKGTTISETFVTHCDNSEGDAI
jgi:hypothetical protein